MSIAGACESWNFINPSDFKTRGALSLCAWAECAPAANIGEKLGLRQSINHTQRKQILYGAVSHSAREQREIFEMKRGARRTQMVRRHFSEPG